MLLIINIKRCFFVFAGLCILVSCKGDKETFLEKEDYEELNKMDYSPSVSDTVSSFLVEGIDKNGFRYEGKIKLKGDIGAGYISADSIVSKFYIEIRRSSEGGLIGIDTNGNEYLLGFKSDI